MNKRASTFQRVRRWFVVLPSVGAIAVAVALASTAWGDPVPVIAPTHEPVFVGSDQVRSIAFAPDKPVLYVHSQVPMVNIWPNLLALWPELLGGVLALATLVMIIVVLRMRARPRTAGKPYCRRCSYDLSPQVRVRAVDGRESFVWDDAARCPECGTLLSRAKPIYGRRFRRRGAPVLVAWLCLALAYCGMHTMRLPRGGSAHYWVDWSSTSLVCYADSWVLKWLSPTVAVTDQVVEIDLATGTLSRTIVRRSSSTFFNITVTSNGEGVFLAGRQPDSIDVLSLRSGRLLHSLGGRKSVTLDVGNAAVIGFSPDGRTAYVQWFDDVRNMGGVSAWRWQEEDTATVMVESPGFERSSGNWPRIFSLRDHGGAAGAPRFLSIPNFMEAFPTKTFTVELHAGDSPEQSITLGAQASPQQNPAVSRDGSTGFFIGKYGRQVLVVDLNAGALDIHKGQTGDEAFDSITRSSGGRFLVFGGSRDVHVRDTTQQAWVANLKLPFKLYAARPSISANGRWIAAVCQGNTASRFVQRLVIWDLGEHRLTESAGDGAKPELSSPSAR